MMSADALIHAIQRRMQLVSPQWRRPPGELPAGWREWFDSTGTRAGEIRGASAGAIIAVFAARPLSIPPGRMAELGRWQAFGALWRQEWQPRGSGDDRRWHWIAAGISGVWHLLLLVTLAWLMYLDFVGPDSAPPKGEEMVVQVEYVGEGTPEEVGGGPAEPVEVAEPAPSRASVAPEATAELPAEQTPAPPLRPVAVLPLEVRPPTLQAQPAEVSPREIPMPAPVVADQPLAVSEPVPDSTGAFVLPPTARRLEVAPTPMPSLTAPAPAIEVIEIPDLPRPSARVLPAPRITQPVLQAEAPKVDVREVILRAPPAPEPLPALPTAPVLPRAEITVPKLATQLPEVRVREIPVTAKPESPKPASTPEPASTPQPPTPEPASTARTAGPETVPAPGAWPSPERADDWGAAERDRDGKQSGEPPGLYDSDGSVRLADTPGSASPGQPPGTITQEIADLDRAGTWLRRPPTDYEPTAFDKYWRPNETLLEEWVRKSITTIRIPIPGTGKFIECQTVLLVVGGGCGITDPNLNNQPATARPPPDIPFKPELQEGNGSVPPSAG